MKNLLLIVISLIVINCYGQNDSVFVFTAEEVVKIDSLFQVYEQRDSIQQKEIVLLRKQLNNYERLSKNDSLHISLLEQQNFLYRERINLYVDLTKELKPKWYEKPLFSFVGGALTVGFSSWVLSNIK